MKTKRLCEGRRRPRESLESHHGSSPIYLGNRGGEVAGDRFNGLRDGRRWRHRLERAISLGVFVLREELGAIPRALSGLRPQFLPAEVRLLHIGNGEAGRLDPCTQGRQQQQQQQMLPRCLPSVLPNGRLRSAL